MLTEYQLTLITAFGTAGAIAVALGISIVPGIRSRIEQRRVSYFVIKRYLRSLHEHLRGFFFFNPTNYIIKPGEISYAYDIENTKLAIKTNPNTLIDTVFSRVHHLKKKDILPILNLVSSLELIFMGLPQHHTFWIEQDDNLAKLREDIFNDSEISNKYTIAEMFESTEISRK